MNEAETDPKLCRKELRKEKLMTYLAAKGKLKPPNQKPYLRDDYPGKKSTVSNRLPAYGKENQPAIAVKKHGATNTVKAAKPALHTAIKVNARQSCKKSGTLSANHGDTKQPPKPLSTITKPDVYQGTVKSCRPSAHRTARHSNSTDRIGPCPMVHAGRSLGPVAQTKKGTLPVIHQQRTLKPNPTQGHSAITAATTASNTNRVRPASAPSAPKVPRGTVLPKTSQCKPAPVREASRGSQNPPGGAKPVSTKTLPPGGPSAAGKRTLLSTRAVPPTDRPEPAQRAAKPAGPLQAGPGERTTVGRPRIKKAGGARQVAAGSGTCAGAKGQRAGSKDGVGGLGTHSVGKGRVLQGNQGGAARPPPGGSAASCPLDAPRTVPRCGPRVEKASGGLQGSRAPQTEGRKSTAAQQERMKKLQEWRDSKGISYKRPPMPVRPRVRRTLALPQPYWATMEEEDQAHSLIRAVDRSLGDCVKLLAEGCPPEHVTGVLSRLPPLAKKFAKYWICQARLMERQGNLDVLPMFEEAVRLVLEPVDDLRTVVFDILKKRDEAQRAKERIEEEEEEEDEGETLRPAPSIGPDAVVTPQPVRALIQGDKCLSSAVKYKITATPGGVRSQQRGRVRVDGQEVRFLTPVRRSVRIERASLGYPAFLREHDPCVASCEELPVEGEAAAPGGSWAQREARGEAPLAPMYVYRENEALGDQVKVRLLYDDE